MKDSPSSIHNRKRLIGSIVLLFTLLTGTGAGAQALPELKGLWTCPRDEGLIREEPISWTLDFEVDWQEGRFFTGTYFWSVDESLGVQEQSGGTATLRGEVRFQGVIGWNNHSVIMVDLGDTGTVSGTFANDDTLQLIGYEAGEHALVAAAICVRKLSD